MINTKKTLKIIAATITLAALGQIVAAQSFAVHDVVPAKYVDELLAKGKVEVVHEAGQHEFVLMPKTSYANTIKAERVNIESNKIDHITESLFLVKKSELTEKSANPQNIDTSIVGVAKILRSVSKMEGMTYFSRSSKKTFVLYDRTYMFSSPTDTKPIPDQNTGNADGQVSYAYQHDRTFGDCNYRLNYYQTDNEVMAVFSNIAYMKYGPIRAVEPEKLRINAVVMDCADSLLVYMTTDCECAKLPSARKRLTDSFQARVEAIYEWFTKQF